MTIPIARFQGDQVKIRSRVTVGAPGQTSGKKHGSGDW